MLHGIDAVLFDLDGTLVDSMWVWKSIDIEYLGRHGIEFPEKLQDDIEGMSFSETAVYFQNRFGITDSVQQIKNDWNRMAFENYSSAVPLKAGVDKLLMWLKDNNIKTGIATSNSQELLDAVIDNLKIRQFFDTVNTACEVEKGKPAPDIFLHVASKLEVKPDRCLVFEDIPPGIIAGKSAGMRVCAVQDDFSIHQEFEKKELADYFIDTYEGINWDDMRK